MKAESEQPKAPWHVRLEQIVGKDHGIEFEDENESVIITRGKENETDWTIEVRHLNEDTRTVTEKYFLDNKIGLVKAGVSFVFGEIPNIASLDIDFKRHRNIDGSDIIVQLMPPLHGAEQVDFNFRANNILDHVQNIFEGAKIKVKISSDVQNNIDSS